MRRPSLFVVGVTFAFGGFAQASDSSAILGTWKTPKHDGKVVIEACGGQICGRVIDGRELRANPNQGDVHNPDPEKRNRRIMGLNILEGYSGGPTEWSGGSVYDPQTGDSSSDSTLTLQSPDVLIVKGCRLFFCRSETWRKIASER
jgi:uncharacterized protein (DUF2147 family)